MIDLGESSDFHSSKSFIQPDDEDFLEVADETRNATTRSKKTEIIDREEEEELTAIDFPESDSPGVDLQPAKPENSDVVVKREIGSFRYRDRFRYLPTTTETKPARETSTRSLSINFDSESDDDRVNLVTPGPGIGSIFLRIR